MSAPPVGDCPLFGRCGGCSRLDRPADLYAAEKRQAVADALAGRGIEAEVIDPRTLKPLDLEPIVRSVQKTGRLVVVNEGHLTGGFTAEVAARVQREAFDWLDAPTMQVATEDVPLPYSGPLELEAIPKERDIVNAVLEVVHRR